MAKKRPQTYFKLIRDLPKPHLRAIGRVTSNWSGLDVSTDIAIGKILKAHSGANAAVTVGITLPFKLDMLEGLALTGLHSGPIRDELLEIIKGIRGVQTDRNFIVHAHWMGASRSPRIYGYLFRKNVPGIRGENWTAKEINDIADKILDLDGRLLDWGINRNVRRKKVPWHERLKPRPQKSRRKSSRGQTGATRKSRPRSSRA